MKLFGRELSTVAKVLLVLVAILLVSSGLCGLQLTIGNKLATGQDALPVVLGVAELAAMLLSAVGIVVVVLALGVRGLYRLSQSQPGLELQEPPRDDPSAKYDQEQ